MGYYLKAFFGAVIVIGCLISFNVGLINLLETGSCGSSNVYVVQRECPDGTGGYMAMLFVGILGALFGAGLFAWRGDRPGSNRSLNSDKVISWPLLLWGVGFGGTGAVVLFHSLTGDLPEDGKLGGIIVAITFMVMGLPVLIWQIKEMVSGLLGGGGGSGLFDRSGEKAPSLGDAGTGTASPPSGFVPAPMPVKAAGGGGDAIDKIARLDELRRSGALTQAEFDAQKTKLLAGG